MELIGALWSAVISVLIEGLAYFHLIFTEWGLPGSWALSIIAFTLLIKAVTLPLTWQQLKSSKAMQELQPKLRELQKLYAKDKEKQMQEQMRLYREHGVNPALGCVPMLIQMPIWFALYQALFALGQNPDRFTDYAEPFLWIADLAQPEALLAFPPVGLPIFTLFTGISQWVLQKMMTPHTDDPQQQMMGQMMQFMPIMFVFFAFQVPAGLVLYWATSNVFSLVQQYFITGWGSLRAEPKAAATAATRRPAAGSASTGHPGLTPEAAGVKPSGNGRETGADLGQSRRRRGRKKK